MKKGFVFLVLATAAALPCLGNSFYVGSDTACFYPFSDTSCTQSSGETGLGTTLDGPLLAYTPDAGFTAPDTGGVVELGTFMVNEAFIRGEGGRFVLDVTFSEPGGGGNTFTATTLGLVVLGAGGAEVTFNSPVTQFYTYPGGEFSVSLPSETILLAAGDSVALDAVITTIPEPTSVASIGAALMLLGCALWRQRPAQAGV